MPPAARAAHGSSPSSARPASARPASPGSSSSTSMAWSSAVWFHTGRSPAYGEGISFWALGEMVRRRAGLLETDDEADDPREDRRHAQRTRARSRRAAVDRAGASRAAGRRVRRPRRAALRRLAHLVRTACGHRAGRPRLRGLPFRRLRDCSTSSITCSNGRGVSPSTSSRSRGRSWWTAVPTGVRANATSPRSTSSRFPSRRCVSSSPALSPACLSRRRKAIVARADGIPLYAVEIVRMLVAEGRLAIHDGVYVPEGDLTTLAVPDSLAALIAARLDGLDPRDRALLQTAAVLGQSFSLAALAAVSSTDEAGLEPRLRALVRRELLTLEADPRSPERGQYAFVQAMIREVAYGTLTKKDRKVRHLAAARFFESLGSDELAGALAGHYLAAHANAIDGPEVDALAGQSRIALRAAAERATSLGAHDQAVAFLTQALTVASDPRDQADLLERAGTSAGAAARFDVAQALHAGCLAPLAGAWRSTGHRPRDRRPRRDPPECLPDGSGAHAVGAGFRGVRRSGDRPGAGDARRAARAGPHAAGAPSHGRSRSPSAS